ncbi:fimbrial protein [Salinivibrio costicola]|uniref:fimbrial protein n=1 Tax=Salinivibrio costicola TaxID=51367 RepID=UPI003F70C15F
MQKQVISTARVMGLIGALLVTSTAVHANNTITFKGEVTDQTCSVTVNDNTANPVVLLSSVAAAELGNAGDTAGQKMFTVGVTGCTAPGADTQITTKFVGNNVTGAGNLGNTGDATNVALQLLDNSLQPVDLTSEAALEGLVLAEGTTSAKTEYGVQYISEEGGATAGEVSASVQYAITYN